VILLIGWSIWIWCGKLCVATLYCNNGTFQKPFYQWFSWGITYLPQVVVIAVFILCPYRPTLIYLSVRLFICRHRSVIARTVCRGTWMRSAWSTEPPSTRPVHIPPIMVPLTNKGPSSYYRTCVDPLRMMEVCTGRAVSLHSLLRSSACLCQTD